MRKLTVHKLNELNESIDISAHDTEDGDAPHRYDVIGTAEHVPNVGLRMFGANLRFQKGPTSKPEDRNGITNEALLAVLIDRMQAFQKGKFACRENAIVLTHLEDALMWLQKRTRDRLSRGIEGTHIV